MNTKHACKKTSPRNPVTPEPEPGPKTPAFAGEPDPITQNLDETQQEIDQWIASTKGSLPDMMINWLIPLYMQAIREELKTVTDNTQRLKLLAQHSLTAVRPSAPPTHRPNASSNANVSIWKKKNSTSSPPPPSRKSARTTKDP